MPWVNPEATYRLESLEDLELPQIPEGKSMIEEDIRKAIADATAPVMRQVAESLAADPSEPAVFIVNLGVTQRIPLSELYRNLPV